MIEIVVAPSLTEVPQAEWDALVGENNPFVEHAFLSLMESSGSVGPGTGWMPCHILIQMDGKLVGAAPTYLKTDSYGEYIFDWAWADAARRAGLNYYPKLVVGVPFTPATGPRLLVHPDADKEVVWALLASAFQQVPEQVGAHSTHVLFCQEEEASFLAEAGMIRRATHQFHWRNNDYGSFDDFLGAMRSQNRKQMRRERRRVAEAGVTTELVRGDELSEELWQTLHRLYMSTSARKWGQAYLTREFFEQAKKAVGPRSLIGLAWRDGKVVAGTLSFAKGQHVYGRYWGAFRSVDGLHFELCYHQLIEHAIQSGLSLVEAGAQGQHKIKRGFLPVITHSVHCFTHPDLHHSLAEVCRSEARFLRREILESQDIGPYKADCLPPWKPSAGIEFVADECTEDF